VFADYNGKKSIGCLRIITAKSSKIGRLRKIRENRFSQIPIFAVNFAQIFLQCQPQCFHGGLGSNPDFEKNRIFAEFFAVYRENRVFRPHHKMNVLGNTKNMQ
jgi:hypothetical protein